MLWTETYLVPSCPFLVRPVPSVTETLVRGAEVQNKFRNRKKGTRMVALLVWSESNVIGLLEVQD